MEMTCKYVGADHFIIEEAEWMGILICVFLINTQTFYSKQC